MAPAVVVVAVVGVVGEVVQGVTLSEEGEDEEHACEDCV